MLQLFTGALTATDLPAQGPRAALLGIGNDEAIIVLNAEACALLDDTIGRPRILAGVELAYDADEYRVALRPVEHHGPFTHRVLPATSVNGFPRLDEPGNWPVFIKATDFRIAYNIPTHRSLDQASPFWPARANVPTEVIDPGSTRRPAGRRVEILDNLLFFDIRT